MSLLCRFGLLVDTNCNVRGLERDITEIVGRFTIASPLLEPTLLRRIESKFVFHIRSLKQLLECLANDYSVLRAGASRVATYRTLYFDTPDLKCFHAHRRGRHPCHKIRLRHYADRRVSYFEIKTKQTDGSTEKARFEVPYGIDRLPDRALDLVRAHDVPIASVHLEPQLWTNFQRLTLLGLRSDERVTIDVDVRVGQAEALFDLDGIVIAEVKQATASACTPVMNVLREGGLRPISVSKYCTAIALTREGVHLNGLLRAPPLRARCVAG